MYKHKGHLDRAMDALDRAQKETALKKATFKIAGNPRHIDYDPDNPDKEVSGYIHGDYFGIHKAGDSWTITHLPTKLLIKSFIDKRRNALRIVEEILALITDLESLASNDVVIVAKAFPDQVRHYLIAGLSDRRHGFCFETIEQFEERMG